MRKSCIDTFLDENKLSARSIDEDEFLSFFLSEMKGGLEGKKSSLMMIPTYQGIDGKIGDGARVIVLDLGGTNFRSCLVTFKDGGKPLISDFKKVPMPGSGKEIDKEGFYSTLADNIESLLDYSDSIGLCFSYAATILENHDGVPMEFSKEVKAPEVVGTHLGASLIDELGKRGHLTKDITVSVVNDTVATLLAAKAECPENASSYIGFILGTGTNTAYLEDSGNIRKISPRSGKMIINVESGCLDAPLGALDRAFWKTTQDESAHRLEKAISGAYLGPLSHFVIKSAIDDGFFSKSFREKFSSLDSLSTTEMSHYLEMPLNQNYILPSIIDDEDDAYILYRILDSIIDRASKLTAVNLTASILKTGYGENPRYPVVINADGTTFYKTKNLDVYTKSYLWNLLEKKHGRYFKMVNIDNSPVLGAAIAGCLR